MSPFGTRRICHLLPLGARSCQKHAGRVSATRRGGNFLFLFSLERFAQLKYVVGLVLFTR